MALPARPRVHARGVVDFMHRFAIGLIKHVAGISTHAVNFGSFPVRSGSTPDLSKPSGEDGQSRWDSGIPA